ncbi:MAG: hypothetical protein SCARUB_00374 [Candidatus Scalindua rubra]|uniref:Uncharacterized protein n=1 Tax=Candidatus Scalindua rubra TaxID=1872076 RepID=A0A1E3XFX3_9BACT|nr:MAG: hypothetical protein SCARUB_00374 [Candidatus Scalindua rubra]
MVFMFKYDKEYHDFLIRNLDKNTLNNINNIDKGTEGLRKEIKEYIKEMSDTRESFRKIDININPVLFEEKLQHANRQLLSAEHIISKAEKVKKQRQDAKDEYLKLKKKILNNKKSD